MIRNQHTKFALNHIASNDTASHFLTNIKSIDIYSLLVTFFALFTMTASVTPAQAELVDLSSPEPIIQISISEANWSIKPDFSIDNRCLRHLKGGTELSASLSLIIDEEGKITSVKIIKSSDESCIDSMAVRQVRKGRLKPLTLQGDALKGRVTLPLNFVIMDWEN